MEALEKARRHVERRDEAGFAERGPCLPAEVGEPVVERDENGALRKSAPPDDRIDKVGHAEHSRSGLGDQRKVPTESCRGNRERADPGRRIPRHRVVGEDRHGSHACPCRLTSHPSEALGHAPATVIDPKSTAPTGILISRRPIRGSRLPNAKNHARSFGRQPPRNFTARWTFPDEGTLPPRRGVRWARMTSPISLDSARLPRSVRSHWAIPSARGRIPARRPPHGMRRARSAGASCTCVSRTACWASRGRRGQSTAHLRSRRGGPRRLRAVEPGGRYDARAFALIASNSACEIAPESRSCFACEISVAAPPPDTDLT
jgi:hypothetical protein